MNNIPKFRLYGEDDPVTEESIQPKLTLRGWGDLSDEEKEISWRELTSGQWIKIDRMYFYFTISYLNNKYLRVCPGKNLHTIESQMGIHGRRDFTDLCNLSFSDFCHIFKHEESETLVLRMLSKLAECYIDHEKYEQAQACKKEEERERQVNLAFSKFDRFAQCLNHIFEQFAVNQIVTRNGFVPRQDEQIVENIYVPTLKVLSDPKWQSVSADLAKMFDDYRDEHYPECITKAHSAVQRFLQVLVGEEGKSGKGEVGKLFSRARKKGYVSENQFTEGVISAIGRFIPSERATNSTAKPSLKDATSSDALLMMNVVMVFIQHCLQNTK